MFKRMFTVLFIVLCALLFGKSTLGDETIPITHRSLFTVLVYFQQRSCAVDVVLT